MERARIASALIAAAALIVLALPAAAQEEETEEQDAGYYVYATYSVCSLEDQWLADELVKHHYAKHYDAAVEAGTITGWGYMAHHTGGPWRRILFHAAPTVSEVLGAVQAVNQAIDEASPMAGPQYSRVCGKHDDYIWRFVTGSSPALEQEDRGAVGFSVYYVCDEANEARADEIVRETLAPLYDAQVEAGTLTSWGWLEHWVGGKYRRLATTTATDVDALLAARDAMIEELLAEHGDAINELTSICNSHQDYIWEIVTGTP